MDKLFNDLFFVIKEFNHLCEKAPTKISTYGKEHNSPKPMELEIWQNFTQELIQERKKLEQLASEGIEKNKNAIDTQLEAFRELSRRMDYISHYWSGYYEEIRKSLSKMAIIRGEIDKKYELGKYAARKRQEYYKTHKVIILDPKK